MKKIILLIGIVVVISLLVAIPQTRTAIAEIFEFGENYEITNCKEYHGITFHKVECDVVNKESAKLIDYNPKVTLDGMINEAKDVRIYVNYSQKFIRPTYKEVCDENIVNGSKENCVKEEVGNTTLSKEAWTPYTASKSGNEFASGSNIQIQPVEVKKVRYEWHTEPFFNGNKWATEGHFKVNPENWWNGTCAYRKKFEGADESYEKILEFHIVDLTNFTEGLAASNYSDLFFVQNNIEIAYELFNTTHPSDKLVSRCDDSRCVSESPTEAGLHLDFYPNGTFKETYGYFGCIGLSEPNYASGITQSNELVTDRLFPISPLNFSGGSATVNPTDNNFVVTTGDYMIDTGESTLNVSASAQGYWNISKGNGTAITDTYITQFRMSTRDLNQVFRWSWQEINGIPGIQDGGYNIYMHNNGRRRLYTGTSYLGPGYSIDTFYSWKTVGYWGTSDQVDVYWDNLTFVSNISNITANAGQMDNLARIWAIDGGAGLAGKIAHFAISTVNHSIYPDELMGKATITYGVLERYNTTPTTPLINSPENNTILSQLRELNWTNSSDVDGDDIYYYVEVDNDSAFGSVDFFFPNRLETRNTTAISFGSLVSVGDNSVVLHMPFEENKTYDSFTKDYSIFNNSGLVVGALYNDTGGVDGSGAMSFDGVGNYVQVPDASGLDIIENITITAWVYPIGWYSTTSHLISHRDGSNNNYDFLVGDNSNCGDRNISYYGGGAAVVCSSQSLSLNEWTFVAMTLDNKTTTVSFYKNGLLTNSVTSANAILGAGLGSDLYLGRWGGGVDGMINGTIDQVKIYNRSLSATEINQLYNTGQANIAKDDYYWRVLGTDISANSSWSNGIFSYPNNAPANQTPSLNSTLGTNLSTDNLNCFFTPTDVDVGDTLTCDVQWMNNSVVDITRTAVSCTNGTLFNEVLASGNLTIGDNWTCAARVSDQIVNSSWVNSSALLVAGITTTLDIPPDNYDINHTTSVTYACNASTTGLTLSNATLQIYNTTSEWYRNTKTMTGISDRETWVFSNHTEGGIYTWNCLVWANGASDWGTNRTLIVSNVSIDSDNSKPFTNTHWVYASPPLDFECNASTTGGLGLDNVTIRIYNETDEWYKNTQGVVGTNASYNWNALYVPYGSYNWSCEAIGNTTTAMHTNISNNWTFNIAFYNTISTDYNTSTFESQQSIYSIHVRYDNTTYFNNINATFTFDGTEYEPDAISYYGADVIYNRTVTIPYIDKNTTARNGWWNFTIGDQVNSTTSLSTTVSWSNWISGMSVYKNYTAETDYINVTVNYSKALNNAVYINMSVNYNNTNFTVPTLTYNTSTLEQWNYYFRTPKIYPTTYSSLKNLTSQITLYDGTNYKDRSAEASVGHEAYEIYLERCDNLSLTAYTNFTTFNFTLVDENTGLNISSGYLDATFNVWPNGTDSSIFESFSFAFGNQSTNVSHQQSFEICLYPSWAVYRTDADMQYHADGYDYKEYYLRDQLMTNQTNNTQLYLLSIALGTGVTITVEDNYGEKLVGYVIKAYKYDTGTGTYSLMAQGLTDDNGQEYIYLRLYDTFYRFVIEKDGELIHTTSKQKILSTSLTIVVSAGAISDIVDTYENCTYALTNTSTTIDLSYTCSDTDEVCMKVIERHITYDNFRCDECSTADSGIISCNVGWTNATFLATPHVRVEGTNVPLPTVWFNRASRTTADLVGTEGLIVSIVFVGTIIMVGLFAPAAVIIFTLVGLVIVNLLGITYLNLEMIIGLFITAMILIWKMRSQP